MTVATFINGCVVDEMVHEDGSTWQGPDQSFIYYCIATLIYSDGGLGPALLEAAKRGDKSTTEAIIAFGGDVNYKDLATGFSALHWGVQKLQKRIVKILLKAGAVVDIKDNKEQTPLLFAVLMNKFKLTEILLDAGANPNAIDWQEQSGLHYCADHNRVSLSRLLLDHGADIDHQDTNSETPLHITARKDDPSVAKLLRVRGADVTIRNIDKLTSYEQAVQNGKMTVATFINGCVVDEMVHEDSSTWQSPDQSIIYYCNATLIYSDRVLGCVVDDKVHEDGSTWQSPDRCIIYYCNVTLVISEEGLCTGVTQPSSNAPTKPTKPSTVGYSESSDISTTEAIIIIIIITSAADVNYKVLATVAVCIAGGVIAGGVILTGIIVIPVFLCRMLKREVDDVIQRRNYIYDKINQPERKNVLSLSTFSVNEAYGCGQTDGQL